MNTIPVSKALDSCRFIAIAICIALTVLLLHPINTHAASPLNISITYPVGSIHDKFPGEAHLVEHLKFKTTSAQESGVYEDIPGASFSASTHSDKTVYRFRALRSDLAAVLKAHRGISTPLDVSGAEFEREKEIVIQEILQRTRSHPDTVHSIRFNTQLLEGTPLAHGPVGRLEEIEALTLEEVKRWNDLHYLPSKALVLISGELDRKAILKTARSILPAEKFTVLVIDTDNPPKKPDQQLLELPALIADLGIRIEPEKPFEIKAKSNRVQSTRFSWNRIYHSGKNWKRYLAAKQLLLNAIGSRLSEGLHDRIAEDDRIVRNWSFSIGTPIDGYFSMRFGATLADGADVNQIKLALNAYLAELSQNGVSDKSFARLKKRIKKSIQRKWENPDHAAAGFAGAIADFGYNFAWNWPQEIDATRPQDIADFLNSLKKPVRDGTLILAPEESTNE